MKTLIGRWKLVAVALAMVASTASAQQAAETGTVAGSVRRAGSPVTSARVVIDSGSDSTYTASTTTDRNGRFTVANAPVGPIGVNVYNAQDQVIVRARGTLSRGGETLTLDLRAP